MVVMWVTRIRAETSVCRYWAQRKEEFEEERNSDNDDPPKDDDEAQDSDTPTSTHPGPLGNSTEFAEQVRIGTSKEVVVGPWRGWCHTVKLTKLRPGTIYVYVVGDSVSRKWSEEFSFKTRPYGGLYFIKQ